MSKTVSGTTGRDSVKITDLSMPERIRVGRQMLSPLRTLAKDAKSEQVRLEAAKILLYLEGMIPESFLRRPTRVSTPTPDEPEVSGAAEVDHLNLDELLKHG